VTGDFDLVPNDSRGYRVAFISAFRERGIFPTNVRHLAEDSLVWESPPLPAVDRNRIAALVGKLDLSWSVNTDRRSAYDTSRTNALKVRDWLLQDPAWLTALGFEHAAANVELVGMRGELRPIEVHSVRPSRRTAPDGKTHAILVIEVTQTFRAEPDGARYRGGCSLLIDLSHNVPKYLVRKRLRGFMGAAAQVKARAAAVVRAASQGIVFDPTLEGFAQPFAALHRCAPRAGGA
jgi:hypothetical protein